MPLASQEQPPAMDPATSHTIDPSLLEMLVSGNGQAQVDTSLDSWQPWADYVDPMDEEPSLPQSAPSLTGSPLVSADRQINGKGMDAISQSDAIKQICQRKAEELVKEIRKVTGFAPRQVVDYVKGEAIGMMTNTLAWECVEWSIRDNAICECTMSHRTAPSTVVMNFRYIGSNSFYTILPSQAYHKKVMLISSFREGHAATVPLDAPILTDPIAARTHPPPRGEELWNFSLMEMTVTRLYHDPSLPSSRKSILIQTTTACEDWAHVCDDPPALADPGRIDQIAQDMREPASQHPQLIFYYGGRKMCRAIRRLHPGIGGVKGADNRPSLGRLHIDPSSLQADSPLLLLSAQRSDIISEQRWQDVHNSGDVVKRHWPLPAALAHDGRRTILHRLFFPFCDIIVLFADDFQGLHEVCDVLRAWCALPRNSTLPDCVKPRVFVIFSRQNNAESQLEEESFRAFCRALNYNDHFRHVGFTAWDTFSRQFRAELGACRAQKRSEHTLFATHQLAWLFGRAMRHVARSPQEPFDFIAASRTLHPSLYRMRESLTSFLRLSSSFSLPREAIMTLIASSVMVDAYQPGFHQFAPRYLFQRYYGHTLSRTLKKHYVSNINYPKPLHQSQATALLMQQLTGSAQRLFEQMIEQNITAVEIRRRVLHEYAQDISRQRFDLQQMCYFCLANASEHMFECGHALCDACVELLGQRCIDDEYHFHVVCEICEAPRRLDVFLKPPTAGVRVIAFDGGGVRGLVPILYMEKLQMMLGTDCDIRTLFDIAFGTSAGGLTVLGLFAQRWPVWKCRRVFEDSAVNTFDKSHTKAWPFGISRSSFMQCVWGGGKHSSQHMRAVLRQNLGSSQRLFGHTRDGQSRVKVGVTITKASALTEAHSDPALCIATNYNGQGLATHQRHGYTPLVRYQHIRPSREQEEILLWQAGLATSAAPLYFEPATTSFLKTCIDGGLMSMNPTDIAVNEANRLWPQTRTDMILSLGTGTGEQPSTIPRWLRWLPHHPFVYLAGWAWSTLAAALDPEKVHDSLKCRFAEDKTYHRLNLKFQDLPQMDDLRCITVLPMAVSCARDELKMRQIVTSLISTSFFFELIGMPAYDLAKGRYLCSGNVHIRGHANGVIRRLRELHPCGSAFRVSGTSWRETPLPVGDTCAVCCRFTQRIDFDVSNLDQTVQLQLLSRSAGANSPYSNSHVISGFPQNISWFISQQKLDRPRPYRSTPFDCPCRVSPSRAKNG